MKTMFDRAKTKTAVMMAPLKKHPVLYRALGLIVTVSLYLSGLLVVDALTPTARMPLVLTAVYFLPAVLRAWLLFYWAVRSELREIKARRETHA